MLQYAMLFLLCIPIIKQYSSVDAINYTYSFVEDLFLITKLKSIKIYMTLNNYFAALYNSVFVV